MKRISLLLLCATLALLLLVGCTQSPQENPDPPAEDSPTEDPSTTPEEPSDPEPDPEPEQTDFRILLTSDIHCTHLLEWYNVPYKDRMQHWVDSVTAEHEEQPFDLIVIMGDVSLDFWQHSGGGSYINEGYSSTDEFIMDYVFSLPREIPYFMMAGNHEQYSNEQWLDLTYNERQGYYVLGNNLLLFLDTFAGELDPDYHHDGKYTGVDMDFVDEVLAEHGDKDIWLIAHYFDMNNESDEFKSFLKDNDNIKGLFHGHVHQCTAIELGEEYNNLTIAQTGNFAYTKASDIEGSFWGFRDLVITADGAESRYIIVESDATINGKQTHIDRGIVNIVEYQ